MKTLTSLVIFFLLATIAVSQPATPPSDGDGSIGNPYQIATLANLNWITVDASRWDKHYLQTSNINAGPTAGWAGGAGWSPIGNSTTFFTGSYNGQGYNISGLTIFGAGLHYGLFGYTREAELTNINLPNVNIQGGGYAGALAGYTVYTVIENCTSSGTITTTGSYLGGLIGYCHMSRVDNSNSSAVVNGTSYVGGLIGWISTSYGVTNSHATGTVTATGHYAGGFAGRNFNGLIHNCYATGNVSGLDIVGGFVGQNNENSPVSNAYSTGRTSGRDWTGGFIGSNANNSPITNSYATGEVNGRTNVGGLLGLNLNNCNITSCSATGKTTATGSTSRVGGLIGYNFNNNSVTNCSAYGETIGDRYSSGGLIGENDNCVISDSRATGDVRLLFSSAQYAGGLIGWNKNNAHIIHCYSDGNVYAKNDAGGLIGRNENNSTVWFGCGGLGFIESNNNSGGLIGTCSGSLVFAGVSEQPVFTNGNYVGGLVGYLIDGSEVSNSFSQSTVTNGAHAGGLVGRVVNSIVRDSYSIGFIGSGSNAGGFVGTNSGGTIVNCFWDVETSGYAISNGGTGKTTAEMMDIATFTMMGTPGLTSPWDFFGDPYDDAGGADFWNMNLWMSGGYPHLQENQCMIRQLPVTLLSYTVNCVDKGVQLSWQTASELNSDRFIILRSSDGENWEEIGSVGAAGNSSVLIQYKFTDNDPLNETAYYKLKQVDVDGKYKFYGPGISNCFNKSFSDSYIFPNPVSEGEFNIFVNTSYDEMCTITVTSIEGKHIDSFECQLFSGSNYIYVDNIHLPVGVYFVSISTIYKQTTHKMQVLTEICGYTTRSKF